MLKTAYEMRISDWSSDVCSSDLDQWQFVTGSKAEIYGLSDSYMVYTKEDAGVPGGYDHSGHFLLVDQNRHIRGAYDGTNDAQLQLDRKNVVSGKSVSVRVDLGGGRII